MSRAIAARGSLMIGCRSRTFRIAPRIARQFFPRLVKSAKEDKCARTLYYLGREYYYYRLSADAIATLKELLSQPDATWDEERMDAMSMIAESYDRLGDVMNAKQWWHRAIAEYPAAREPYLGLALHCENRGYRELAAGLAGHALRNPTRMTSMFNRPAAYDGTLEQIVERCK
jgi:tetratricopeptide (TPR) repeat protein